MLKVGIGIILLQGGVAPRAHRLAAGTATLAELVCRPAAVFSRPPACLQPNLRGLSTEGGAGKEKKPSKKSEISKEGSKSRSASAYGLPTYSGCKYQIIPRP